MAEEYELQKRELLDTAFSYAMDQIGPMVHAYIMSQANGTFPNATELREMLNGTARIEEMRPICDDVAYIEMGVIRWFVGSLIVLLCAVLSFAYWGDYTNFVMLWEADAVSKNVPAGAVLAGGGFVLGGLLLYSGLMVFHAALAAVEESVFSVEEELDLLNGTISLEYTTLELVNGSYANVTHTVSGRQADFIHSKIVQVVGLVVGVLVAAAALTAQHGIAARDRYDSSGKVTESLTDKYLPSFLAGPLELLIYVGRLLKDVTAVLMTGVLLLAAYAVLKVNLLQKKDPQIVNLLTKSAMEQPLCGALQQLPFTPLVEAAGPLASSDSFVSGFEAIGRFSAEAGPH